MEKLACSNRATLLCLRGDTSWNIMVNDVSLTDLESLMGLSGIAADSLQSPLLPHQDPLYFSAAGF